MKNGRLYLALVLGLGLVLIGLFAFGGLAAPLQRPADPTPSPAMNTHTAPRDSVVSITYSEAIDPATVSTSTFAVHAMQTGLLTQTYSVNGGTISLTPSRLFKPGELVQASATTETLNLSGQGPISPTVWQFRAAVDGGAGNLANSLQSTVQFAGFAVDVGDVNGDGSLDIYAANTGFVRDDEVWLNDGSGDFTSSGWTLGGSLSQDIALGDLNGDGRLDAFIVNAAALDEVWINVGPGGFVPGDTLGATEVSLGVALGDVDGDGDLDAFVVNDDNQANQLWLNDGSGSFTNSGQSLGSADAEDVALGDLDGDGDLDAFVVNDLDPDELYKNNGRGGFSLEKTLGTNAQSYALALGDVDGNGTLDAVVANESGSESNTLWINEGGWVLTDTQTLGQAISRNVALGDLDGDGDLDLVIANDGSTNDVVWLNDGGLQGGTPGSFTQQPGMAVQNTKSVELGDLDGDGDLDVVLCAGSTDNVIWFNADRANLAIWKSASPSTVSPGQRITYTLTYSNLGPQTAKGIVISDTVPSELTDVQCSAVAGVITPTGSFDCEWEVADRAPGQGGAVYVSGVLSTGVTVGETYTNTASITSTLVADYENDNDRSSVGVTAAYRIHLPLLLRNYP
jgi:uncharacterized repeat protein (TIGR01451 family)